MGRSKYNVDKDVSNRTCDGIVFDSKLEMRYYRDVILPKMESGEIVNYELQKKYVLLDGFEHKGQKVRPITYIADFYVEYADGHSEVIDTKGMPDAKATIKRKLFWYKFPDVDYIWMSYVKKFGGWVDYDTAKKLRNKERREKRAAELKEDAEDGEESEEDFH